MPRVKDKVALITGAARGQGRAHAVRLAEEGADIVAIDVCADVATVGYAMATSSDIEETAELVRATGRRVLARQVDVRDLAAMEAVVADAVDDFGGLDIVSANAGVVSYAKAWEMPEEQWQDVIDINLTGVWHTVKAAVPPMIQAGRGGSIVITSSMAGLRGFRNCIHYIASKHGATGIMRALAAELSDYGIRVNSVHPSSVNTAMIHNQGTYRLFRPDLENPARDDFAEVVQTLHMLPEPWCEPRSISDAVLFLASDEAKFITGVALPVDAGAVEKLG